VFWLEVIVATAVLAGVALYVAGVFEDGLEDDVVDAPDSGLPADRPLRSDDIPRLRFGLAIRGYRMRDVDAALSAAARSLEQAETRGPAEPRSAPTKSSAAAEPVGWPHEDNKQTPASAEPETSAPTRSAPTASSPTPTASKGSGPVSPTSIQPPFPTPSPTPSPINPEPSPTPVPPHEPVPPAKPQPTPVEPEPVPDPEPTVGDQTSSQD